MGRTEWKDGTEGRKEGRDRWIAVNFTKQWANPKTPPLLLRTTDINNSTYTHAHTHAHNIARHPTPTIPTPLRADSFVYEFCYQQPAKTAKTAKTASTFCTIPFQTPNEEPLRTIY